MELRLSFEADQFVLRWTEVVTERDLGSGFDLKRTEQRELRVSLESAGQLQKFLDTYLPQQTKAADDRRRAALLAREKELRAELDGVTRQLGLEGGGPSTLRAAGSFSPPRP